MHKSNEPAGGTGVLDSGTKSLVLKAALAESLFLNGQYRKAASLSRALFRAGWDPVGSALKVAESFAVLGDINQSQTWLVEAHRHGVSNTSDADTVIQAKAFWNAGNPARAWRILEHADLGNNGGGAAYWILRTALAAVVRPSLLRSIARQAAERFPGDSAITLNNALASDGGIATSETLSVAMASARAAPYDPQPRHVLARLNFIRKDPGLAEYYSTEAVLRERWNGPFELGRDIMSCTQGIGFASGEIDFNGRVTLRCDVRFDRPPDHGPVINAGYGDCIVNGLKPTRRSGVRCSCCSDDGDELQIPATTTMVFELRGMPKGRGISRFDGGIELDGSSGWLPMFGESVLVSWFIDLVGGTDQRVVTETPYPSVNGSTVIVLPPSTKYRSIKSQDIAICIVDAGADQGMISAFARYFGKSERLWTTALEPLPSSSLYVLPLPRSRISYARNGYIRSASGAFLDASQGPQLSHEAGHCWWGISCRFHRRYWYLSEAFAELSLHLLEEQGLLVGYRSAAREMLCEPAYLDTCGQGLEALARIGTPLSQTALRVKGGLMLWNIRAVMGSEKFEKFLFNTYRHGKERFLTAFDVFAIAGEVAGHRMDWIANRWIWGQFSPDELISDP